MKWKHQIKIGAFLIMMLTVLTYMGASAFAEFGFAPPPASDMSRSFLNQIFGGLLDGGQDAFGASIKSFNAAVLVVGGILAAYTIFSATLGTAHDGEMLGKKFSSVWIPIRYTLGTALVLPVLSGGYCIMQGIVMWLIMQGVSIANGVWSEYMSNPPSLVAMMSKTPNIELVKIAEEVYLMQVCVQGNHRIRSENSFFGKMFGGSHQEWTAKQLTPGNWEFGLNKTFFAFSCGTLFQKNSTMGPLYSNNNDAVDNTISHRGQSSEFTIPSIDGVKSMFVSPSYTPVLQAHYTATDQLVADMGALAQRFVGGTTAPVDADYQNIIDAANKYQKTVNDAAVALLNAENNIREASTAHGWFIAGSWITQIIINQNKLNSTLTNYPEVGALRIGTDTKDKIEPLSEQINKALLLVSSKNSDAASFLSSSTTPSKKSGTEEGDDSKPGFGGKIGGFLTSFISGVNIEDIKDDKRHPLIIMSSIGNSILNSILLATAAIAGIALASGLSLLGGMAAIAVLIVKYGTFAIPIAGFIGIGASLAYIIPNLPFILWIGIIIGWTVMCVEAILAAPLWAVMHLHPNGDDMTGKGANGYMLVLGLLLRPALIIFGLIAAITLSGLFGQLVNSIFFNTFAMNQGDATLGFWAVLFGTGLYAAIMMTVIKQCFNLMHMIPDQLLRWIGGGQEQLGQYAGASSEAITKGGMIGGMAAGLVTTDVMKSGQGVASGILDKQREKKHADSTISANKSNVVESLGASAGDVVSAIDANHGGGFGSDGNLKDPVAAMQSLDAIKQKSEFQALSKSFQDTPTRTSFNTAMAENLKSGKSFNEARDAALSHAVGKHFGGNTPQEQETAINFAQRLSSGTSGSWGNNPQEISNSLQAMQNVQHLGGEQDGSFNEAEGQRVLKEVIHNTDAMQASPPPGYSGVNVRDAFAFQTNALIKNSGNV